MLVGEDERNEKTYSVKNYITGEELKNLSFEKLKPEFIRIYTDAFSQQEIDDMIEFYQTPTGKKTIELMPDLMGQGAEIGQAKVQANIAELQDMIAEESKHIQALQSK